MERLILVNEHDEPIGFQEKLKAHELGQLHRAFSIFIFNQLGQLLIQRRALKKYHCGGLWSNTCCGHPRPNEDLEKAAHRRLAEELGFDCPLWKAFEFTYKIKFENELWENEYVHVIFGQYTKSPKLNPEEVSDWKWINLSILKKEIQANPEKFTYWLEKELSNPNFMSRFKEMDSR